MANMRGTWGPLMEAMGAEFDRTPPRTRYKSRWVLNVTTLNAIRLEATGDYTTPPLGRPLRILGLPIRVDPKAQGVRLEVRPRVTPKRR